MVLEGIGARIRALRRKKGLTLNELASRCQLSASFLSQVERGMISPSIVSLYRFPLPHLSGTGDPHLAPFGGAHPPCLPGHPGPKPAPHQARQFGRLIPVSFRRVRGPAA
ncbi:helix-turn-helix transcriptional regulator [Candidatus Bipolaricaulota bacterium]|nr:helix-turn-helix transcriptional regulator [Candidatus Bipolaricaulota bacterium]